MQASPTDGGCTAQAARHGVPLPGTVRAEEGSAATQDLFYGWLQHPTPMGAPRLLLLCPSLPQCTQVQGGNVTQTSVVALTPGR